MGYPTKIQIIKRAKNSQWYVNFPSALAKAMEFERGEILEWVIENKQCLVLQRVKTKASEKRKIRGTKKEIEYKFD